MNIRQYNQPIRNYQSNGESIARTSGRATFPPQFSLSNTVQREEAKVAEKQAEPDNISLVKHAIIVGGYRDKGTYKNVPTQKVIKKER